MANAVLNLIGSGKAESRDRQLEVLPSKLRPSDLKGFAIEYDVETYTLADLHDWAVENEVSMDEALADVQARVTTESPLYVLLFYATRKADWKDLESWIVEAYRSDESLLEALRAKLSGKRPYVSITKVMA